MNHMKIFLFCLLCLPRWCLADLDVFVIGDSQIGYNHHVGFEQFFKDPKSLCGSDYEISNFKYSGYGASGSGIHHWTQSVKELESQTRHGQICNMEDEKKFFGIPVDESIQEYEGESTWGKVCAVGASPLRKVLELKPKIIVASFLGAHTMQTEKQLRSAIKDFEASLPKETSCVFITSPPMVDTFVAFSSKEIDDPIRQKRYLEDRSTMLKFTVKHADKLKQRLISEGVEPELDQEYVAISAYLKVQAQTSYMKYLEKLATWQESRSQAAAKMHSIFAESGRCHLVKGFDENVLKAVSSSKENYLDKHQLEEFAKGEPQFDPFHLTAEGSLAFFQTKKVEICESFKRAYFRLSP
jgi:hypothetical protein